MGTEAEMRLVDLFETLHDVVFILKDDAEQLERLERIELKEDWEEEIPRLAHRYEKEIRRVSNQFSDPEGEDYRDWMDAHLEVTKDFLVKHGLARQL